MPDICEADSIKIGSKISQIKTQNKKLKPDNQVLIKTISLTC
jgi:hypothetical protein